MARKSSAALSVATPAGIDRRPIPPGELTDEQREVWTDVVNCHPGDWFTAATFPALKQYCRHSVAADRIAQLIIRCEAEEEFDFGLYDDLLKAQDRESKVIASLGTKMRIMQQSSYNTQVAGTAKRKISAKPWAIDGA